MKHLPLLAILTLGSFSGAALAQTPPPGVNSQSQTMKGIRAVAKTIITRINEVSGGVDNIAAIREGKNSVVGYYNMKGAIVFHDIEVNNEKDSHGEARFFPFEIELRTDGTKLLRLSIGEYDGEQSTGLLRKFKVFDFMFDDRSPNIEIKELKVASVELALSVFSRQDSWIGPVVDADLGAQGRRYNLQGTDFPKPYPSVEKLTSSAGFLRALVGVGFSQKIGSLKLNGKIGYQIVVSENVSKYARDRAEKESQDGTLTDMRVGNRRSSVNAQLNLTKNVGKVRIGIFYEGDFYRTDTARGFDGQTINVAPLGVQTPHRAGIRINF